MTLTNSALLLGLVVVPALLLWLGHRLRDRTPTQKGAFWGGVIGHTIAMIVAIYALHVPGVIWTGGARELLAFWSMLLGGAVGAALGGLRARFKYGTAP
jgi:hypothetical protein